MELWSFIEFTDKWNDTDTSSLDELSPSWFLRREALQDNSQDYREFIEQLKREHAIETGVVERMYDLTRGVTETLIKNGFVQSYISHGDTNIPVPQLFEHLKDHLEAVDFVFDMVKDNRTLTVSFIKELHALTTRHQNTTDGIDQFGNNVKISLEKGVFKRVANNPTRGDGSVVQYCPPEQVASEMDNLIIIYEKLLQDNVHPIIIAAWVHHAFTTIHPFQDGNGRVARLLASLILIKANLFPFTVLRDESRAKYINALEKADVGDPQPLISFFCEVQRRKIEKALNINEISGRSFDEVADILADRLRNKKEEEENRLKQGQRLLENINHVVQIYDDCLTQIGDILKKKINNNDITIKIYSKPLRLIGDINTLEFYLQGKTYELRTEISQHEQDETIRAINASLILNSKTVLSVAPHIISIADKNAISVKNIRGFLENAVTLTLAEIANSL